MRLGPRPVIVHGIRFHQKMLNYCDTVMTEVGLTNHA